MISKYEIIKLQRIGRNDIKIINGFSDNGKDHKGFMEWSSGIKIERKLVIGLGLMQYSLKYSKFSEIEKIVNNSDIANEIKVVVLKSYERQGDTIYSINGQEIINLGLNNDGIIEHILKLSFELYSNNLNRLKFYPQCGPDIKKKWYQIWK